MVQARRAEYSIIGVCLLALVLIFQPYSVTLFTIGAGLVVFGGLAIGSAKQYAIYLTG